MIDHKTFIKVQKFIYNEVGIVLNEGKKTLVTSRLNKRLRKLNIAQYDDYFKYVINDKSGQEIIQLVNVISTNVTHFFRENDHFMKLAEIYKESIASGNTRFRVWSSACSSGEEPYSMAITLQDILQGQKHDTKILATDISTDVLALCQKGVYHQKHMETVDKRHRGKYFIKFTDNENKAAFQVNESMKKMILFKRLNLSKPPFPLKGNLDVIFCRNVMIYFDDKVKSNLIHEFYRLLKPGGHLFVGHSESLAGLDKNKFKLIKASVYYKE